MAEQNFPDNTIYELDNLDVLRGMNSDTVDLIATDPPFNTKRNRSGTAGFYVDNWKWKDDTKELPDQWAWNEVHPVWLDEIKDENQALFEVIEAAGHCHGQDIAAFLCFLSVRLLEMHRVLKPTGSIYLHCDDAANAYIRMAMDAIFGARNFKNEVVWKRTAGRSDARHFGRVHDCILLYSKSKEYTWNTIWQPHNPAYIDKQYRHEDELGRWTSDQLTASERRTGESGQPWRGIDPGDVNRHWNTPKQGGMNDFIIEKGLIPGWPEAYPKVQQKLDALDKAGLIHWPGNNGMPRLKRYLAAVKGTAPEDVFTDIGKLEASSKEKTGSPDQKPSALYERFILASSNENDLVLDPFAGCATTLMAARNQGRRWVGIDRRPDARHHVVCRMLGLKAEEAEKIRANPMYGDWLTARLAELETYYRTEPPVRTDEGDTAAPFLAAVHTNGKSTMSHRQMKDFLVEEFGKQCWGCDFDVKDERYLQLDHADPKRNGGSNDLDNRVLLCQPCNLAKSDRITLIQLRRDNAQNGYLTKPAGAKRGQDGHPIDLPTARARCRAALDRHRAGQPLQTGMML